MTTKGDVTMPVALAATLPLLVVRLGLVFVRLKAKRRKGVRAFRSALVRGGMSPAAADRLAAEFESYGRIRAYLPGDGRLRIPFRM